MKVGIASFSGTVSEFDYVVVNCDCMWCDRDRSDRTGEPVGRDLDEIVSDLLGEPPAEIMVNVMSIADLDPEVDDWAADRELPEWLVEFLADGESQDQPKPSGWLGCNVELVDEWDPCMGHWPF